jgi:hypothetical protein
MFKSFTILSLLSSSFLPLVLSQPVENSFQKRAKALEKSGLTVQRSENGPVITKNFPDSSLLKVNSTWYAFATQSPHSGINIPIATSSDFETWTVTMMDALPATPDWVNMSAQALWAPDVNELVSLEISAECIFELENTTSCDNLDDQLAT